MANQYKNKVVYGNTTVIDISDTTATASDVASGKKFYAADGSPTTGTATGGAAVTVTEEALPGGGTAKHITAVDISNDTVDAAHLATGYTAHDAQGNALVGTMSGGSSTTIAPLSVTQNGTYTAPSGTAYSPVTVNVPSEGGGGSASGDVTFYDYDGTVVDSYSAAEFATLTAMPANPSHTGLTAQGWNWSLSDAKTYVATYGKLDIGQMYITDDGKTRLYITVDNISRSLTTIMFACSVVGGVTIDWGDGSATEVSTATSRTAYTHDYTVAGNYIITLDVTSGTMTWVGSSGTSGQGMMGKHGTTNIYNCTRLRKLEIGTGINEIGAYWFYNCYSLTSITIPRSVTSIGASAFYNCYSLMSITFPSSVTSIGSQMFYNCYSLMSITFPSSVTSIGSQAFYGCYSLMSITIPSGVTSIENNTFYACYSLTTATIPSGITSIGSQVFQNCYSLMSITIPDSVTSIGLQAFNGCYSLTSVTFPSRMTSIGNNMFTNCYSLTSVTIPSGVTSIGDSVFYGCYSLASIVIPSGVASIGTGMVSNCQSLTSLTVPRDVTSIGSQAFYYCYGMKEYHLLPTTPPTLANTNTFTSIPSDCIIYVPYSADHSVLEAYQTATNWSTYASYMQEEPT